MFKMMEEYQPYTNFDDISKSKCMWTFQADFGEMHWHDFEKVLEAIVWRDDERSFLVSPVDGEYILYASDPENTISQAWRFFCRMKEAKLCDCK